MVQRFDYKLRFNSEAVIENIPFSTAKVPYFSFSKKNNEYVFGYPLKLSTRIYGLGENVRGINKKGHIYISNNTDDPNISEDRVSLYASHNFIIFNDDGLTFGAFFDTPNKVTYDLGHSDMDLAFIKVEEGFELYIISGKDELDVISQFRKIIGQSYLAPYYAFGIAQSRWGYKTKDDIFQIINDYEKLDMPLDLIYMDIDCLDNYKDFTLNSTFANPKEFVDEVKKHHIHLVPIVDAAIKIDDNYPVYKECLDNKYYCSDSSDKPFVVGVWAGDSLFPDFFNEEASNWFARQYKYYLDAGINSFWNDMNEPVLFYSKTRIDKAFKEASKGIGKNLSLDEFWHITGTIGGLQNNEDDYLDFFHNFNGEKVAHKYLHNYYSYYMVKNTAKYLKEQTPEEGYLLFSRSSCIGSHRYSGIWTGDNASYWSHLLLNFKMMPSLNMCGYLYSGADLGGFGKNSTEDLLLRWLAFGLFSPLLRNHSSLATKRQEFCYMKHTDIFKKLLSIRYALLPYIYHSYVDAMVNNKLIFTPLSFVYKDDENVKEIEDELLFGDSILLAPVFNQNVTGRYVYLPEDMLEVRMKSDDDIVTTQISKGHHYIKVNLDEVVFFIRKDHFIPLTKHAKNVNDTLNKEIYCLDNGNKDVTFKLYVPLKNTYTLKKIKKNNIK